MNKLEKTHYALVYRAYPNMKGTTPRWESIKYVAKEKMKYWKIRRKYDESDAQLAKETILWQSFSGISGEWLEVQNNIMHL